MQATVLFNRSVKCDGKACKSAADPPQLEKPALWNSPKEVAIRNFTRKAFNGEGADERRQGLRIIRLKVEVGVLSGTGLGMRHFS